MTRAYIKLTFVVLLLAACGREAQPADKAVQREKDVVELTGEQVHSAGIRTGRAETSVTTGALKLSGKIDVPPQNIVSLAAPMGGYVRSAKLLNGDHVTKGQTIAILEDQQYITLQQEYLTAKARLAYLEKEYVRQKELNRSKAASDKVFEQTEMEFNTQKAVTRSMEEKLRLIGMDPGQVTDSTISRALPVKAPVTGYVMEVHVNLGRYCAPGEVLYTFINPDDMHLSLTVYEKDLPMIREGQKVIAYTNSEPDRKYECEVILVARHLDRERSAEVHCHFTKPYSDLVPGTFMNAELQLTGDTVMTLPEAAVVRSGNGLYTFTHEGGNRYRMHEVRSKGESAGRVQVEFIAGGSLTKREFVVDGAYNLLMALKNSEAEP